MDFDSKINKYQSIVHYYGTQQKWDIYSIGDKSLCSKMNSINKDARKLCSAKRNAENVKGKKERSEQLSYKSWIQTLKETRLRT